MDLNFGVFGSGAVFNLCHGPALSNIQNVKIKFYDRQEKRVGDDAVLENAEDALKQAMEATLN